MNSTTATTIPQFRKMHGIPANAFLHVPDGLNITGYRPRPDNAFEHEPIYNHALSETEGVLSGVLRFRVQIDKHTVREFHPVIPTP